MIYIGVDCGAKGAIAVLDGRDRQLLWVKDMPADVIEIAGKQRSRVSPHRLADLLRPFAGTGGEVAMFAEIPTYRPLVQRNKITGVKETRQAGAAGMAALGESVGMVRMAAAAFGIEFTGVSPGGWKRRVNCPADKDAAIKRACEIWPVWAKTFARKKDDGRAEAAMIALFGAYTAGG